MHYILQANRIRINSNSLSYIVKYFFISKNIGIVICSKKLSLAAVAKRHKEHLTGLEMLQVSVVKTVVKR